MGCFPPWLDQLCGLLEASGARAGRFLSYSLWHRLTMGSPSQPGGPARPTPLPDLTSCLPDPPLGPRPGRLCLGPAGPIQLICGIKDTGLGPRGARVPPPLTQIHKASCPASGVPQAGGAHAPCGWHEVSAPRAPEQSQGGSVLGLHHSQRRGRFAWTGSEERGQGAPVPPGHPPALAPTPAQHPWFPGT